MSKEELDARSMKALMRIASTWYDQMKAGEIPSISLPTRTRYNIEYRRCKRGLEVWRQGEPADSGNGKERDAPPERWPM